MTPAHTLRPLAALLAAAAVAAPAAAARPFHHPTPAPASRHDMRFAAPSGDGIDAAPLAVGLGAIAAAFAAGAGVTLRRRQPRPVA